MASGVPMSVASPELLARSLDAKPELGPTLEALLFVAHAPLALPRLAELTGASERAISTALARLQRHYRGRGLVITRSAAGYQFVVAAQSRGCVRRYWDEPRMLSDEATETLALVAYLQPITHEQLCDYRGSDPTHVLETLRQADFITTGMDDAGMLCYRTTSNFLACSNLDSLDDLPLIEMGVQMDMYAGVLSSAASPAEHTSAHSLEYAE